MSVLSAGQIKVLAEENILILESDFNEKSLRPASYDVTVAASGLIEPDGNEIPPEANNWIRRGVILESGDTAVFSSKERFCMPDYIAGNLTVRNALAKEGLALLSGALIDPGYGMSDNPMDQGSRLYLHVANLGKNPIIIRPGFEKLARVQFLLLSAHAGDYASRERRDGKAESRWEDQRLSSLGFFAEMKKLKTEVERSSTRSKDIVLFGLIVLAIALIGAELTALLTLASNSGLLSDIKKIVKGNAHEYLLWLGLFIGLPLAGVAIALWSRGFFYILYWSWRRRPRLIRHS